MSDVQVRQPVVRIDVDALRRLAAESERATGHPALGDAVWRDLEHPTAETALLVAREGRTPVGALHVTTTAPERFVISVVVGTATDRTGVAADLVTGALDLVHGHGGGTVELWVFGADDRSDELARTAGFALERELWQMRVVLPCDAPEWPAGVTVRSFDPSSDEEEWVRVNNAAFSADPDQGGWTVETLRVREAESWFDASGFLLAYDRDGLAGFCWTKVHPASPPLEPAALGEIYVIGVEPSRQGTGLGRALVLGGLHSLHSRGVHDGMLFVDARNQPAVKLYRALGFDVSRADRAYTRAVS